MNNRYRPIYNNGVLPDTPREEIVRELTWYKENGYGGFAVNGTTQIRLKDEQDLMHWLEGHMRSVKLYCEVARELGLDMWLFDEWGYPSGCACGLVLTPETRPKKLNKAIDITLEAGESVDMPAPDRLLSVGAIPVDRFASYHPAEKAEILTLQNGKIFYTASRRTRVVAVTWEPLSFVTHMMKDYTEGDTTFGTVDIMDAAVVRKYLDNMHERYAAEVGDEFGKTIKGFFYDEPELCWEFPYTHDLPAHFMKRHGYDITAILPELVTYMAPECGVTGGGDAYPRLKKAFDDYTDAWTSLLADSFYGQIETWCHDHNLLSVGHQDLDNHAETLLTVSGDFYRNSARNDMPGVDVIWDNIFPDHFDDFPRFAGSVKRALGKKGAMSETFAEMGSCMPPDVMRFTMEHQILRGIDQFFLYTFHNSQPQPDPNVGLYTKAIMDRAEQTARMLNDGRERARVAVMVPLGDIAFERMHLNPHQINGTPLPWERLDKLAQALCYAPIDFEYTWEDAPDNLRARGYEYLILTGNSLTPEAAKKAEAFHADGGKVFSAFYPCPQAPFARHFASLRQLVAALPQEVRLTAPEKMVSMASRTLEDGVLYALLNESEASFEGKLSFQSDDVACLDLFSGQWRKWNGECIFQPREMKMFKVGGCALPAEKTEKTVPLTDWTFNGRKIADLVPWTELGLAGYTGFAEYETEFDWDGGDVRVNLGEVGFAAQVTLDGKIYDVPFSPWSFRTTLAAGHHKMQIRVLNSDASRCFARPEGHRWGFEECYLRCGLLGKPTLEKLAENEGELCYED